MSASVRPLICALGAAFIVVACARPSAPTTAASPASIPETAPGGGRTVGFTIVSVRDSGGRTISSGGSSTLEEAKAASDAINRRVRVLRVSPDHLVAQVGDTLAPLAAVRVTGLDSAGATIPRVTPLYGPLKRNGVLRWLPDGRWLAAKPGRDSVMVRVMRHGQAVRNDTALVRAIMIEVVP